MSARCSSVQINKRLGFCCFLRWVFCGAADFGELSRVEHVPVTSAATPIVAALANSRRLSFIFMERLLTRVMDLAIPIGTVNPRLQITKAIWSILHSVGQKTSRFSCFSILAGYRVSSIEYRNVRSYSSVKLFPARRDSIDHVPGLTRKE